MLSEREEQELARNGYITVKSIEQLEKIGKAATDRFEGFREDVKQMTQEQAEFIRKLRVSSGCSWREVAQECYDHDLFKYWQNKDNWYPKSNQLMGMSLCEKAAESFAENYREAPWN